MIERLELMEQASEIGVPTDLVKRLYDQGWRDCDRVNTRNRLQEAEKRKTALVSVNDRFQLQIDEARLVGLHEGMARGRMISAASAPPPRPQERRRAPPPPRTPPPSRAPERTKASLMEEVMAECRIISESNPSMKPAINALKHRLKKI